MEKNNAGREPTDEELDDLNEHWQEPGDPDGVVEADRAEQAVQERHAEPMPEMPKSLYKRKRRWPIVLLVLVLVAAAGVGAYWFGGHKAVAPSSKKATTSQNATQSTGKTTSTKSYNSTALGVALSYPTTWTPAETSTKLTITSPSMQLATSTGKQASGHIVVTIQPQQTTLPQFAKGNAVAALESQRLTYAQPTAVQRAQTYLSFLQYAGSTSGGLDALYITGDNGYQGGQAIPMVDVVKGNPLISVTFDSCVVATCGSGTVTPLSVAPSVWKSSSVSTPVVNLLQSIALS